MSIRILKTSISLILLSTLVVASESSTNETWPEEIRQPKVTGRIVKLYSGTRPEPIYCANEGFQPDPVNCGVFYRCVRGANNKYTVFRFQCGPGTVYDPETEVCNFPSNTKRSECGGQLSPSFEKQHENEIEGAQSELPSPISSKPVVEFGDTTLSSSTHTTSKPKYTEQARPAWMTTGVSQSLPLKPALTGSQQERQDRNACTTEGFMSDSDNCRKFYRCVGNQRGGFIRYEFMCSDTTVWDEEVQSCNHPWAVRRSRCSRGITNSNSLVTGEPFPAENQYENTVQQQMQINYGQKVSQTQTQISHGAVIQNQTQINYGGREDNNSAEKNQNSHATQNQTQISYGSAISQTQTQINHAHNGMQTQLQIDHTKESSQAQSQVYETTLRTTTASGEQEVSKPVQSPSETHKPVDKDNGHNECSESGFMGDNNDCNKFYRCVDNGRGGFIRYEFTCGEGTVWDSSIEACNHAWAVKECGGKVPQNLPQPDRPSDTTTTTQNYHTTSENNLTDQDIDAGYGNQIQDQQLEQTSSTSTVRPQSTTEQTKPIAAPPDSSDSTVCTSSEFMGDPKDCKKFYRCVDNGNGGYTKYEFKCGEGTVWDSEIEACNHEWAVKKCGGSSENNKEESTSTQNTVVTTVTLIEMTTQSPSAGVEDLGYEPGPSQQSESSSTSSLTTARPEVESSNNNECKTDGFMGDKKDCKKFYRCVDSGNGNFIRYEFSCGEGTVWDSEINACNHERDVKRPCGGTSSTQSENAWGSSTESATDTTQSSQITSESETTGKPSTSKPTEKECSQEGFMGDKNDCKKFYRCVDNGKGGYTKHEFSCGEGTVWDSEITACNHPQPGGKCKVTTNQESPDKEPNREDDEFYAESTSDSSSSSIGQSETTTTSEKPHISDDRCTSEGFYGDKKDCKKFYRCVDNDKGGYTKYDFTCGEGTVWDQEIQGCNHESSNPECSQTNKPQSEATDDSSTTKTTTEQQHSTEKTESPLSESSGKCESEGFFANPSDCKKFYRCVDNGKGGYTKYDFSCGDGTVWVQDIQACDHDDGESGCKSNNAPSSEQQSTTSSSIFTTASDNESTQQPEKENDNNQNEKPPSAENNKCTDEGFYPNKDDCKRFYRCVNNGKGGFTKYDFTCGEGTAWDSDIQSCNHIGEVKGCQESSSNDNQQQSVQEDESQSSGTTGSSNPSTESSKPSSKDTCSQEGYYGNTQDCTKFYRCVDDGKGGFTKYDFDCGEGTIWDQDITTCNHPQDVANPSCQQSDNSESSSSSSSTTSSPSAESSSESSTSASSTSDNNNNSSSDCSGTTKKPANKDVNCTKEGYYPNPDDCKKFYRCVDWDGDGKKFSVYHFECGEGTIWDPALDTCNHEDSVYPPRDCSGGESQSENVGSESTSTEESTTTEKSTTEETTTQETTTSVHTTNQQTTDEQTTTEMSTTSEQTTTQENTEKSTTDQTTEQTTKQTAEETTTQQTTEQTTTQQATEQSTSEQTTAQTTTQETTEHTTTQQNTEQTTMQQTTTQSTNEEQTTTQQSSTSEQTTLQNEPTTQESTTQQSESTSTTEDDNDSTTQDSTESSTQESTTENSTDKTTEESETTESTTSATDSSTTESTQDTTTESGEETTESQTSEKDCPETDDDQNLFICPTSFKRHPKYCNMFYQCTEDDDTHDLQIATFRCPNNTIYDESQTKCVEEKKADKKCDGEIAQKRRVKRGDTVYKEPIVVTNERLQCPTTGHFPFEKNECSPAFLKCQKTKAGKLRGYVYQCPENHVYWSVSRRCEPKSHVRDCKRSQNIIWKGRWEIPVERRNVAK